MVKTQRVPHNDCFLTHRRILTEEGHQAVNYDVACALRFQDPGLVRRTDVHVTTRSTPNAREEQRR